MEEHEEAVAAAEVDLPEEAAEVLEFEEEGSVVEADSVSRNVYCCRFRFANLGFLSVFSLAFWLTLSLRVLLSVWLTWVKKGWLLLTLLLSNCLPAKYM